MESAGLTMIEMADELGVHRATIGRWLQLDDIPIRAAYLKQWAVRCHVDYDWLITGRARLGSNQRPTVYKVAA